jgi:hypothetical protein
MDTDMERNPARRWPGVASAAVFLFFLAVAALATSAAGGEIWLRDRPERAAALPLGPAEAEVRVAWAKFRAAMDPGVQSFPDSVPDDITAVAAKAFTAEPTSERAVSILALASAEQGKAHSREIYRAASALSKRNDVVNSWLIVDYGQLGQVDPMLRHLDYLLRTDPEKHEQLMPLLVGALAQRDTIPLLAKMLRAKPNWADNFWNYVLIAQPVLGNAAELRAGMGQGYEAGPADFDGQLVTALVSKERYQEALRAYDRLSGNRTRSILHDPTFSRDARMPPVDWQTFSEGGFDAEVDAQSRMMFVSADGASPVIFARQLIELPGGRLQLQSEWESQSAVGAPDLEARITCVQGAGPPVVVPLPEGKKAAVIMPPVGCRYAWFELVSRGSGLPYEAQLKRMSLDRVEVTRRTA